jgi:hypothetical protein
MITRLWLLYWAKNWFCNSNKSYVKYKVTQESNIPESIHKGCIVWWNYRIEVDKEYKTKIEIKENKNIMIESIKSNSIWADTIAALYKIRWQIELLFKQTLNKISAKKYF